MDAPSEGWPHSPENLLAKSEEDGPEAGAHVGVDEKVDAGVDGEEEGGDGGSDERPDGDVVAVVGLVLHAHPEAVQVEELVQVDHPPRRVAEEEELKEASIKGIHNILGYLGPHPHLSAFGTDS